ncbi:MAG: hypothetical protein DHS80DRAFT_23298 [Piptocephalis tieghemiana]|nr:MAG: hypothetical protein DHS80DRAFT_23298 [Piptocephalis tieghemiana]
MREIKRVVIPVDRRWRHPLYWIPVIFIFGLMGYGYYVYVDRLYVHYLAKEHKARGIVFLVIFSILWLMFLLSYTAVLLTRPGFPGRASSAVRRNSNSPDPRNLEGEGQVLVGARTTPQDPSPSRAPSSPTTQEEGSSTRAIPESDDVAGISGTAERETPSMGEDPSTLAASPASSTASIRSTHSPPTMTSGKPQKPDPIERPDSPDFPVPLLSFAGESLPERPITQNPRWCYSCKILKGDRVHHCSTCDECIERMDQ